MICRLVLSLRKATDPNVIRAWNVDHFSIQLETRARQGLDGVRLTPILFHSPTVTSSERGVQLEGDRLTVPIVNRSPPDSRPHSHRRTVDGFEGEERPRRESKHGKGKGVQA